MDSDPFVLDVRLNGTDFVTGLVDSDSPRQLEEAAGKNAEPSTVLDTVTYASIDIDGHQQKRVFFYVVPGLTYDVILGKPWLEDADVTISAKQGCLDIGASNIRAWNHKKASYKPPLMKATQVMASAFMAEVRRSRRKNKGDGIALDTGLFAVSIADIEKALKPRKRSDPKTKLPPQYHQWLKAFDHFLSRFGVSPAVATHICNGTMPIWD
ncbi:hypothetical protein A1F94_013866 [Pyrenophora tritici-repentis]|nr:hypothetical protein A1F94_013866 [Pyrenophora tritici-repentis]